MRTLREEHTTGLFSPETPRLLFLARRPAHER